MAHLPPRVGLLLSLILPALLLAGCGPTTACPEGTTSCEGRCVVTTNDPENCGACGQACGAGLACIAGRCSVACGAGTVRCGDTCVDIANDPAHCGDCVTECASGELCSRGKCGATCGGGTTRCGGACVDTATAPAHCGDCATACAVGEVCSNGRCGSSCSGGTTRCGAACVDTMNDPAHCGACTMACAGGEVCSAGQCGLTCGGGTVKCGSSCVRTSNDPAHCGSCATRCATGEVCSNGQCSLVCAGGSTKCGGACVDTAHDPRHCGDCATACAAGEVCSNGQCQPGSSCAGGTTACGGACVNTATDPAHCGSCTIACPATQACAAGTCGCPAGRVLCGTTCVNPSDNSLHCGACGQACGAGAACVGGACVTPPPGNGRLGGSLTGSTKPKVAVLGAASSTDLQTKLAPLTAFSTVDFINVNATTPTLAQLRAYDAVAVYTYLSVTAAFGDNLADYFEAGGGVVLFDYETQESGTFGLKGRFETAYTLSTQTATFLSTAVTLGALLEPSSPLLTDVASFSINGMTPFHLPASAFNKNGPVVVANFSDGSPAVVRGVVNGRNLVEINSYGLSSATTTSGTSYGWNAATDGAKLVRNALLFVIPAAIASGPTVLDLGAQAFGTASAPQALTLTNTSGAPQALTALSLGGSHIADFGFTTTAQLPVTISPGATITVNVTFQPSSTGLRAATLSATFSGAATPLTTLLTGTGT